MPFSTFMAVCIQKHNKAPIESVFVFIHFASIGRRATCFSSNGWRQWVYRSTSSSVWIPVSLNCIVSPHALFLRWVTTFFHLLKKFLSFYGWSAVSGLSYLLAPNVSWRHLNDNFNVPMRSTTSLIYFGEFVLFVCFVIPLNTECSDGIAAIWGYDAYDTFNGATWRSNLPGGFIISSLHKATYSTECDMQISIILLRMACVVVCVCGARQPLSRSHFVDSTICWSRRCCDGVTFATHLQMLC